MPFQRGNTLNQRRRDGNRTGRPRSYESMPDLLREMAQQPHPSGLTMKERIAQVVVQQAALGNPWAVAWFTERTEGKVTEKVEQSGTVTQRITVDYGDGDGRADD